CYDDPTLRRKCRVYDGIPVGIVSQVGDVDPGPLTVRIVLYRAKTGSSGACTPADDVRIHSLIRYGRRGCSRSSRAQIVSVKVIAVLVVPHGDEVPACDYDAICRTAEAEGIEYSSYIGE